MRADNTKFLPAEKEIKIFELFAAGGIGTNTNHGFDIDGSFTGRTNCRGFCVIQITVGDYENRFTFLIYTIN
jgi:hypothetical protein